MPSESVVKFLPLLKMTFFFSCKVQKHDPVGCYHHHSLVTEVSGILLAQKNVLVHPIWRGSWL